MAETSAADGEPQASWWSVPQAVIWIVTRGDAQVLRAADARMLATVARMTGIRPQSGPDVPPVSLAAAPDELLRAWLARRIVIVGRERGSGQPMRVPLRADFRFRDHGGEACLGEKTLYFNTRPFWSSLWVRADECRHCWPAPAGQAAQARATEPSPGADNAAEGSDANDREIERYVKPILERIEADGRQARRDQVRSLVEERFGRLSKKRFDRLWPSFAPHAWQTPSQGRLPTARQVEDIKAYLQKPRERGRR